YRRNRIDSVRQQDLLKRLVQSPERSEAGHRIPVVRGSIPGIEADGALKFSFGAQEIPILGRFSVGEGGMGFRGIVVEQYGPRGMRCSFGPNLGRRKDTVVSKQFVGIG